MREDWVECTLEDISYKITDGSHNPPKKESEGYLMLSAKNIAGDKIDFSEGRFISKENFELENRRTQIANGDVLLTIVATIGRSAVVREINIQFVLQRSVAVIGTFLNSYYLNFQLQNPLVQSFFVNNAKGTAQKGIYLKTLSTTPMKICSFPEQRAIVKKIETLFSSLDASIADLKKSQGQLKIYRQAVLKKAFEGEYLGAVSSYLECSINDIKASISSKMKIVKLGSLISLQGGFAFKSNEFKDKGIPVIKIANVNLDNINWDDVSYIDEKRSKEFEAYSLSKGDVLIAMTRPVIKSLNTVKTVIVKEQDLPCFLNQRVGRFLIKENSIIKEYLQYFIKSTFFKDPVVRQANDSLLPNLSAKTIENFEFIIPSSLEEQNQIVKEIESRLSVCDAVEKQIKDSLIQAEALRQSILKKAFEGKLLNEEELKACKEAPDYEPASILLEKIKAEKEAAKLVKKITKKKKVSL